MNAFPALKRLSQWYREAALPLWGDRAWDGRRGGFYEALDFRGAPVVGAGRRVRVQARQIYTFAGAARLGWSAEGEALARKGFAFFFERCCPGGGDRGCVHRLTADNAVADDRRDLYDQAFLLLACAGMHRAFGEPAALALAERTAAFLDNHLAAPAGGFAEDTLGSTPRRQNPHMHLFEAFMALAAATGDAVWRTRAEAMFALFENRFLDRDAGVLREFFADDWSPDREKGNLIEPGHMAEWVWLLEKYRSLSGAPVGDHQRRLIDGAVREGEDARGFLIDQTTVGGGAHGRGRRLWPQTEYLKALLVAAHAGDPDAAARAEALAGALFETYLAVETPGLWCDHFDGEGRAAAPDVPASILYHLHESVVEIERFLKEQAR